MNTNSNIDTIILKFSAGCNLLCDYCYEYQSGDETWKTKPKHLIEDVAAKIGRRIRFDEKLIIFFTIW